MKDRAADADLFLAEVADATPLRDRDRIPAPEPERRPAPPPEPSAALAVERHGEHAWARAPGVSEKQLADLRAGRLEPEATIDLHGLRAAEAAERAEVFVSSSVASGRRCVLVITGRGRRSGGISVVKEEVLDALCGGKAARQIRALCTAQPRHGGSGAFYVALKRS